MNCAVMTHIVEALELAWRKQEHHEIMRLTKEGMEHRDKCPVCRGIMKAPAVPLEDLLFGRKVTVVK
jgi:hypothetical protein